MKKSTRNLGRFTMKLVSLLVICGFISLACLPMVHAMQGNPRSDVDYGDCQPEVTAAIATYAEEGEGTGDPDPTYVTITIQYCDTEGKKIASDKVVDDHPFNTTYRLIAPEIPGYELLDAAEEWTKEIKADTLITIHYKKIVAKAALTIYYEYEDGTEAATTHTEEVEVGKDYEVTSPTIDGYTPDQAIVSGTMEEKDIEKGVEVTVTYTKDTTPPEPPVVKYVTITLRHEDTAGEVIAEDTTQECEADKECDITPEPIDGYTTPNSLTKAFSENETVTFLYEKVAPKATLTIHYVYADGSKAADDYTEDIEVGKTYRIESPRIANYTPNFNFVTGEMITAGVVVTVTYTQNTPDQPTEYTITIYYQNADGKEIAPSTTEVRTAGEHTFDPKEIPGYIKPVSQTIIVSADDSITFIYEKDPASNPEQPGDEPGADDPQTPTDPKDPTNPGQEPGTQQPSNQGPISLPTAGASDTMIREFLVLDAEVSAGGIGLWAISGAIRKARRR